MDFEIDYNEQMLNYYPQVIRDIKEFQVLINTQSLEIKEMHEELAKILSNAYIGTCDESVLSQWEQFLGIIPLAQGDDDLETWLADRRETILARLYSTPKLDSATISDIVKIFTGGTAISNFKDGTINILITPPESNKQYKFENVEQALRDKIPAHLALNVIVNYFTWNEVLSRNATWDDIKNNHTNWDDVLYHP